MEAFKSAKLNIGSAIFRGPVVLVSRLSYNWCLQKSTRRNYRAFLPYILK